MRRIGGREEGNGMMILSRGNDDMYRSFLSLSLFVLPYYNCIIDVHENEIAKTRPEGFSLHNDDNLTVVTIFPRHYHHHHHTRLSTICFISFSKLISPSAVINNSG